ncbi:MAG: PH domain-containing protein [Candidatus Paceibacterota bacterium]|jgi:hypothetical protein
MLYKALHLESDEHVVFEVRKHWIVFVGYATVLLFAALLPIILFKIVEIFIPEFFNINFYGNKYALFLFFYTLWLLFLWISFFVEWTKYYLDVWYVTEKRIIIIDQKNIFHREVSNLRFDRIQDVTLDVQGFIPTFLKFGNIRVQTASENSQEFNMTTVRHPEEVRRIIFSHQNKVGDIHSHTEQKLV